MRLSSILCLLVLLGLPSVSWAQAGTQQTPSALQPDAHTGDAPSAATLDAGQAPDAAASDATHAAPSEPSSSGNASDAGVTAEPSATSAPSAGDKPAVVSAPLTATPDASIPSPGELGDRLVGDLPPPPDAKTEWTAPTPIVTLHGYFRVRGELMDRFWLGRDVVPQNQINEGQPDPFSRFRPLERSSPTTNCADESVTTEALGSVCKVRSLQFANLRFRFSPELNITEDIRIKSTFDILDNYVLGTGPQSFYGTGAVQTNLFPGTDVPTGTLIVPRRIWAEVRNRDLGELRFGLMPEHWGLGMLYNAGNGLDDDYSTDLGRVMVTTKLFGFYLSAAYDFMAEGQTTTGGEFRPAYDHSQLEDLDQFTFSVVRRVPDEDEATVLARGDMVLNGGLHFQFRHQDSIYSTLPGQTTPSFQNLAGTVYTPDLWGQLRVGKLRLEVEGAWVAGKMHNLNIAGAEQHISQFGAAFESELRLLNDKMGIYFYMGGATGDSETEGLSSDADFVDYAGDPSRNNQRVSTFRFSPAYRVDLILWRTLMRQVTGAYYFKPGISYDFLRDPFGQLFGARVDAIYSRASAPVQTWGNDPNLGIELDAQVYWQSADGPGKNDGYHAALQYGVLFPMRGLAYIDRDTKLATAQTLRLILGVVF
jgi:uncharacterized protein (TIGR04551 family)